MSKAKLKSLFPDKESEAEFKKWWSENATRRQAFEKSSDGTKMFLWALTEFWYQRVNARWGETIDLVRQQRELIKEGIPAARRQGQSSAILANLDKLEAHMKQQDNLAAGRIAGVKSRQKSGAEKQGQLIRAIGELFDKPEKPGWRWTNDEIVAFLRGSFHYAEATILKTVKREAAKCRKAGKLELASKFPSR